MAHRLLPPAFALVGLALSLPLGHAGDSTSPSSRPPDVQYGAPGVFTPGEMRHQGSISGRTTQTLGVYQICNFVGMGADGSDEGEGRRYCVMSKDANGTWTAHVRSGEANVTCKYVCY